MQKPRLLSAPARPEISDSQKILIGLMVPMAVAVLNWTMFNIAVLDIRETYALSADVTAWLISAMILAIMISTPVYGSLGDALGRQRMLLVGLAVFLAGTIILLLAPDLRFILLGRVVQGLGSGAFAPLSIAIISARFSTTERGKALGTWAMVAPVAGMIGPVLGGLIVDNASWRLIYPPVLGLGAVAWLALWKLVPATSRPIERRHLLEFDWLGVALLGLTVTSFVFFVSSRAITGIEGLQDWRLLLAAGLLLTGFLLWEKRRQRPFVKLALFRLPMFRLASIGAALWMFTVPGSEFVATLYLTDVFGLTRSQIGLIAMLRSAAFMVTLRLGGQLADRWGSSRGPVMISGGVQFVVLGLFASFGPATPIAVIIVCYAAMGLGAGLSMAALHRSAMESVSDSQMGMAAGLYSTIRFGGTVIGIALLGIVLQQALEHFGVPVQAYQFMFALVMIPVALIVLLGWQLRTQRSE